MHTESLTSPLVLQIVGDVPAAADWEAVLAALERWPTPGRVTLERRWIARGHGGVSDHVVASSDAGLVGGDPSMELESLVGSLRAAVPLKSQRLGLLSQRPVEIAVLPDVGSRGLPNSATAESLLGAIAEALAALPAPAGMGVVVWSDPSHLKDDDPAVVHHLSERVEVHVRSRPSPLRASLRIWAGAPLPPGLLARLAALVGADGAAGDAGRW